MIIIKNVILYDPYGHVVGFVEFKNAVGGTAVKLRNNLADIHFDLSINEHIFNVEKRDFITEINPPIQLDNEIRISITQQNGNTTTTLAHGIINENQRPFSKALSKLPPLKSILQDTCGGIDRTEHSEIQPTATAAVHEIDEVLRAVCRVNDQGKGMCETCPYRGAFYGEVM